MRREKESLAPDNSCTVCKTGAGIRNLLVSFLVYVCGQTPQICEAVIATRYPENGVKGRITNGSQWPIITAGPEEHRRGRLAQTQQTGQRPRQDNTIEVHDLNFQVFTTPVSYAVKKWLPWEQFWQQKQSFVMLPRFGNDNHKQSLENLELPNCQSG